MVPDAFSIHIFDGESCYLEKCVDSSSYGHGNISLRLFIDPFFCLKMEHIIERMQDDSAGVSVKNVKTFMNKIPSVFTGKHISRFVVHMT